MPSIKDVAEEAGVSIATVSNVINNRRVRPETAEKVRRAIEKLNYSQNLTARNLVIGRSHILGLIVSDLENPFFSEIARRFHDQALLLNMETIVMHTNYDPHRTSDCIKRLVGLQVPGVGIMTSEIEPSTQKTLLDQQICSVYFELGTTGPWSSNIAVNYETGLKESVEHLIALGHRRLGFIGGPPHLPSVLRRKNVFAELVRAATGENPPTIDSDGTFQGSYFSCSKILARSAPTALICGNDTIALGALHCAHDKGMKVPADLSIIGFDNTMLAEFAQPSLSSVQISREEIARLAIESVTLMMANPTHEGIAHEIETTLVTRQSTAPPPG